MDKCSYFIPEKALFGSFPSQEMIKELEESGVRYFVDLTEDNESKTIPYQTSYTYIKHPIHDRKIPENWTAFAKLILNIVNLIKTTPDGEKIYIHCRGGHGRSGILVACILCHYYGIRPTQALEYTKLYHSQRKEMREKWRHLGSPQEKKQKDFVHRFFRYLRFGKIEDNGFGSGLSNFTDHSVCIPEVGTFLNAHLAFKWYKNEHNNSKTFWDEHKIEYMKTVLSLKFKQHSHIRTILKNTGLRPIIKISHDAFWGIGDDGKGLNIQGKILEQLRSEFILNET